MRSRTWVLLSLAAVVLVSIGVGVSRRGAGDVNVPAGSGGLGADAVIVIDVLNGTSVPGLAADVSLVLGRIGAAADLFANAPHDTFARSLLINRRLPDARAVDLARRLGDLPVLLEHDPDARADAVLVIGADHERVRRALGMAVVER